VDSGFDARAGEETLFAGGRFDRDENNVTVQDVGRWSEINQQWTDVNFGDGVISAGDCRAFTTFGKALVAGGDFDKVGTADVAAHDVAEFDADLVDWTGAFEPGFAPNAFEFGVHALIPFQGKLFAGGGFTLSGGSNMRRLASWNGTAWTDHNATPVFVRALHVFESRLYIGGSFTSISGTLVTKFGSYDGTTFTNIPIAGAAAGVNAITSFDGKVIVTGSFLKANGAPGNGIAAWDPVASTWSELGIGLGTGLGNALAVHQGDLYAGGTFMSAGGVTALRVARWDGTSWSALGTGANPGLDGDVKALTSFAGDLIVGGQFSTAGNIGGSPTVLASNIARFDGVEWVRMVGLAEGPSGVGFVLALLVFPRKK